MTVSIYVHRYDYLKYPVLAVVAKSDTPLTSKQIAREINKDGKIKVNGEIITKAIQQWRMADFGFLDSEKKSSWKIHSITETGRKVLKLYVRGLDECIPDEVIEQMTKKAKESPKTPTDAIGEMFRARREKNEEIKKSRSMQQDQQRDN